MYKLLRIIALIIIGLMFCQISSGQASHISKKEKRALNTQREVPYYLPYNDLLLEFNFESIRIIPGRFSAYAEPLLGIRGVNHDTASLFHLSDLTLTLKSAPDPARRFSFKDDSKNPSPYAFQFAANGILYFAGHPDKSREIEPAPGTQLSFKRTFPAPQGSKTPLFLQSSDIAKPPAPRYYIDSTGNRIEIRPPVEEKGDQNLAREIAGRIQDIQSARSKLLSGYQEIAYSSDAIRFMNQSLEEMQRDYMRLFLGDTIASTEYLSISYSPDTSYMDEWMTLFRFDPSKGILPPTARIGDACKIRLTPVQMLKSSDEEYPLLIDTISSINPSFIYFREPLEVRVEIMLGNQYIMEKNVLISQLGRLSALPLKGMDLHLDPNTGLPVKINFHNKQK